MSESDSDSDIQADIQALTQALALPTTSKLEQEFVFDNESRSDSFGSVEASDDEHFNFIYENEDNESLNAYEMNAKLIRGLTIAKKKLNALLQECERKIKELDERMSSSEESCLRTIRRLSLTNAGMPYFKDKNHFRAPKNYDTKLKESRGELFMSFLKKPSRWTERDREILLKAIHNEAIESILSKGFNKETSDKEISSDVEAEKGLFTVPRNFKEMVGRIGEREFDWHKISRIDFEDKHSPGECQAMWNVYLHPDFNKNEWTPAEDNRLLKCAKECRYQDWDTITQILGTNRSAYQCFIRYNTIKGVPSVGYPWPKEEDKCLLNTINHLKIGDYIPWCEIANHMRNRTKQQIYNRWHYRKAPHLKKGRFTYLETKTLLDAVEKYGPNFCKISNSVMPNRSSVQLNERYSTIMLSLTCDKTWTLDDDKKLLQLQLNLKNNWSEIAMHFSNKSRTQVRHRFHALQRYLDKNIYLEDIPRPSSSNNIEQTCRELISRRNKDGKKSCIIKIDDIQLRLYEILSSPLQVINSENSCDSEQLSTRKLYNMLNILNANLDFSNGFMNFACLNSREKQLLASLKEYINLKNNKMQNHEEVEKFRMQMFGDAEEVSENSFIPPLPFDGYIKTLKKKESRENQSIDCERIDVNEKFIIDVPTKFSAAFYIRSFIDIEEEYQFHKFGQLLISDTHECDEQRTNLYKRVLKCHLIFDQTCTSASEYYNYGLDYMDGELITVRQRKWPSKFQIPINEYNEDIKKLFSDVITPNRATLLGLKNLLVWKLLYEYEFENCDLFEMFESDQEEMEETNRPKSTEYQLLQTRLSQLFKLPIGLSNTKMEIKKTEPKTSFLINKKNVSKKRKFEDTVELSDTDNYDVLNNSSEFDSNVKTADLPIVRSCKVVNKKLKIIA